MIAGQFGEGLKDKILKMVCAWDQDQKYEYIINHAKGPRSGPDPVQGPQFKRDQDWDQSSRPEMTGTGPSLGPSLGLGSGSETFSAIEGGNGPKQNPYSNLT